MPLTSKQLMNHHFNNTSTVSNLQPRADLKLGMGWFLEFCDTYEWSSHLPSVLASRCHFVLSRHVWDTQGFVLQVAILKWQVARHEPHRHWLQGGLIVHCHDSIHFAFYRNNVKTSWLICCNWRISVFLLTQSLLAMAFHSTLGRIGPLLQGQKLMFMLIHLSALRTCKSQVPILVVYDNSLSIAAKGEDHIAGANNNIAVHTLEDIRTESPNDQ